MRISDWSSDVCSSDLLAIEPGPYIGPVGGVAPTYAPDAPRKVGNRCGCRSGLRPRRSALLQTTARNVVRQVPQPHRPEQHRQRPGIGFGPAAALDDGDTGVTRPPPDAPTQPDPAAAH